ncbi:hypothetical protein P9850_01995 [Anoxybacillus rupiensis]|uniref:Uncharacterized protein n=1 Tax=Anoxybacteroides rupiense TaxID=311460 RepID=A0ABD5IRN0_9BACL|nr:hypothetical protein [Anoxybacillus rupiensis]
MKEISGTHKCYKCGKNIRWKSEVFHGNPSGIIRSFGSEVSAECTFVGKNKVELRVRCNECYNYNKFIVEI